MSPCCMTFLASVYASCINLLLYKNWAHTFKIDWVKNWLVKDFIWLVCINAFCLDVLLYKNLVMSIFVYDPSFTPEPHSFDASD